MEGDYSDLGIIIIDRKILVGTEERLSEKRGDKKMEASKGEDREKH